MNDGDLDSIKSVNGVGEDILALLPAALICIVALLGTMWIASWWDQEAAINNQAEEPRVEGRNRPDDNAGDDGAGNRPEYENGQDVRARRRRAGSRDGDGEDEAAEGGDGADAQNRGPARRYNAEGDDCPICLGPPDYAAVTNCGHAFCTECILAVFEQADGQARMRPRCPVCRGVVHTLVDGFREDERGSVGAQLATESMQAFNRRNEHLLEQRPLHRFVAEIPHMAWQVLRRPRLAAALLVVAVRLWMLIAGAVLYVLSPFDLLPESVLGLFGLVDDFAIVVFVAIVVLGALYVHMRLERGGGGRGANDREFVQAEGPGEREEAGGGGAGQQQDAGVAPEGADGVNEEGMRQPNDAMIGE